MLESTNREKILKNIRNAVLYKSDLPFDDVNKEAGLYADNYDDSVVELAEKFSANGGGFIYCASQNEIASILRQLYDVEKWENVFATEPSIAEYLQFANIPILLDAEPADIDVVVSYCECLVASKGSILLSSRQNNFNKFFSAQTHVIIGSITQVVDNVKNAISDLQKKYKNSLPSMFTFVGSPSCSHAIEDEIITPALGSAKLFLLLVDNV